MNESDFTHSFPCSESRPAFTCFHFFLISGPFLLLVERVAMEQCFVMGSDDCGSGDGSVFFCTKTEAGLSRVNGNANIAEGEVVLDPIIPSASGPEDRPPSAMRLPPQAMDQNGSDINELESLQVTASTSAPNHCSFFLHSSSIVSSFTAMKMETLPPKAGGRFHRYVRWNFFSVYRQLFTITFLANLIALLALAIRSIKHARQITLEEAITATSANLCASIVARNEHFVNLLFTVCVGLPKKSPLWLKTQFAKIYNYGGIHSGCAVSAVAWFFLFTGIITSKHLDNKMNELQILAVCWVIVALFIAILAFAHPALRFRLHNHFEAIHRFAGWTVLFLFWLETVFVAEWQSRMARLSMSSALTRSPTFWFLICITLCIAYPWMRLRVRTVRAEFLSEHAVRLHFDYAKPKGCSAIKIADSPLKETHAFAVIPAVGDECGFSVIVSDAGDWTRRIIRKAPKQIYTRGAPQQGVIRVAALFNSVVIVATGSGIGPCLGLFNQYPSLKCRVLWSTPNPVKTYGQGVIDAVRQADPEAVIIDTKKSGRQDMVAASYSLYQQSAAEAVIIISNGKLTWKVVYGLETRGVSAYGPIWDC